MFLHCYLWSCFLVSWFILVSYMSDPSLANKLLIKHIKKMIIIKNILESKEEGTPEKWSANRDTWHTSRLGHSGSWYVSSGFEESASAELQPLWCWTAKMSWRKTQWQLIRLKNGDETAGRRGREQERLFRRLLQGSRRQRRWHGRFPHRHHRLLSRRRCRRHGSCGVILPWIEISRERERGRRGFVVIDLLLWSRECCTVFKWKGIDQGRF